MRDFAVHLTHRPGELSRIASALAKAGVNLKSVAAMAVGNQGVLHLIADDVQAARDAFQTNHIPFEEREVLTVLKENRAGELADVADRLANANVNLEAIYIVGLEGDLIELAVVVDDPKKAKKVLE
jgi:hypothetical protein